MFGAFVHAVVDVPHATGTALIATPPMAPAADDPFFHHSTSSV